jgi:ABC-type sugar transport system substrate-binding protein
MAVFAAAPSQAAGVGACLITKTETNPIFVKMREGASAKAMFSLSEKWDDRDDESAVEKVDVLEDRRAVDPVG